MQDYGQYHIVNVPFPSKGMNRNISAESLPVEYSHTLENILPIPLGEGSVRFGTKTQYELKPSDEILEMFGFTTKEGQQQLVLYVNRWHVLDEQHYDKSASCLTETALKLKFNSNEFKPRFKDSAKFKLTYEKSGLHHCEIIVSHYEENEICILHFENIVLPKDSVIRTLQYQAAYIAVYDVENKQLIEFEGQAKPLRGNLITPWC